VVAVDCGRDMDDGSGNRCGLICERPNIKALCGPSPVPVDCLADETRSTKNSSPMITLACALVAHELPRFSHNTGGAVER